LLRDQIPLGEQVPVYSSDLTRALQTAAPIAAALGTRIIPVRGLREICYGEAEGKPQSWLDQRFQPPPPLGDRLDHDFGINGAETRREFASRVYDAVESILESSDERSVIVTHGFALTFVVACWIRMPLEATGYMNVRSSSGGITELVEDGFFHNRQISRLNDTAHLAT
jgi:probable phosphoglycerate mutase